MALPDGNCSRRWNEDRKSTRLNSSHGYISYAVFCLKKKKNQHALATVLRGHLASPGPCAPEAKTRGATGTLPDATIVLPALALDAPIAACLTGRDDSA